MINLLRGALGAALVPLLLPFLSQAAPDPLIRLTPQQASSFASAFTALSQQAHVALVAEDQPLHPALMPASVARLKLNQDGEPLSTLLPKLAAAYDYDVQPSGVPPSGQVFLLRKRYTDAADLPSITVQECALGLEEANRYVENFNPHIPLDKIGGTSVISDLVYSLTPAQLAAMGDSKRGVPVASLSPTQQQEVQQFVMHLYVQQPTRDLPAALGIIHGTAADPQFGWRYFPQMSARLFGYDAPAGYKGFHILSKPNQVTMYVAGGMEVHPVAAEGEPPPTPQDMMQLTSAPDPTDPVPTPANAPPPDPPVSSSLGDILTRMNVQATGPKGDGLKVTVEPYLAPKRVTVFGEEAATPRQEVAALADVYGLRVFTDEKEGGHDRLRLMRRTAPVPLNLLALHDSILQALPDPLVRAYRAHDSTGSAYSISTSQHGVAAVRQLRTAAEPKIKSRDGRVALSALSEQEGRAFAMTLMLAPLSLLGSWVDADLPDPITRFNDLRLGGGLYEEDGKKKLTLTLLVPDSSDPTMLTPGPGIGNLNYDPVNHTL